MILKKDSFSTPEENILFDEVLLSLAEQNNTDEVIRFWESNKYFIVLGRTSDKNRDINLKNVSSDCIPIIRRCSGGGTVLQGKGCLNYSLILSKENNKDLLSIKSSYSFILNKIILALKFLGIYSKFMPISDIALIENRKKISGNAQKRSRKFILHHGTILYDFDINIVGRYINIPQDTPIYREGRSHSDFIANIYKEPKDIINMIKGVFSVANEEKIFAKEKRYLNKLLDNEVLYKR